MSNQDTAGAGAARARAAAPAAVPVTRSGRPRATAVVAVAVAVGVATLAGSAAGSPGRSLAAMGPGGSAGRPGQAVALGGSAVTCAGIRFNPADLPGRPIGPAERSGPAEGIAQVLRLYEWNRHSPYDGATWSVVNAADDAAVLVARTGPADHYIPVRRRPDGHWQIDAPCHLEPTR